MASLALAFDILARDRASRVFNNVGDAAERAGKKGDRFGKGISGGMALAGGAVASGAAAVVTGLGVSIKKAMDFDKTMRTVGATLGTSGPVQKQLSDLALKLGKETAFSASDASDAMLELAKGGMTAVQIKSGALASTLTLASAGGLELGDAATYMSNSLNTFGLPAKDAAKVAAALAGAANASTASVESMGLALSQVGPGAKTAGLSLQTTTGILAAFDNAGIKGNDAGTSLKTMLTRLVPSTKAARNAMHDLGLKFTDAHGTFLPMTEIAQQLQDKLKGLSDEQRTTALATIFGSDATRAATVLADLGAKGVQKYTKATSDQGAAQRMAKTATEGASGAWESFTGTLETIAVTLGQKLLPFVEQVIRGANDLASVVLDNMGPAFGKAVDFITPLIDTVKLFIGTITGDGADVEVPWMNAVIDAGSQVSMVIDGTLIPAFAAVKNFIVREVAPRFLSISDAIRTFVEVAVPIVQQFVAGMIARIQPMMPQIKAIFVVIGQIITGALELIQAIVERVTTIIAWAWKQWGKGLMDTIAFVWQTVISVIGPAFTTIRDLFTVFTRVFKGDWSGAWKALKKTFTDAWKTVRAAIDAAVALLGRALKIAWDAIVTTAGTVWSKITSAMSGPINRALQFIQENLIDKINGLFSALSIPVHIQPIWTANGQAVRDSRGSGSSSAADRGGFAAGGVLPGWSPGRDVHEFFSPTGGRLALSGGEAFMVPEFTRMVGGKRGIDRLNARARRGQSFAGGGVFESIGNVISGIWGAATDPLGAMKRLVSNVLEAVGNNPFARLVGGMVGKAMGGLIERVKGMFGAGSIPAVGVDVNGQRLDTDTLRRIRAAGGFRVIQGSWSHNPLSMGTHAGSGAADLVTGNWGAGVARLRAQGLLAMFRNWTGNQHIHTLNPWVQGLSSQALAQVRRARANNGVFANGGVLKPFVADSGVTLAPGINVLDNRLGRPEPLARTDSGFGQRMHPHDLAALGAMFERSRPVATISRVSLERELVAGLP